MSGRGGDKFFLYGVSPKVLVHLVPNAVKGCRNFGQVREKRLILPRGVLCTSEHFLQLSHTLTQDLIVFKVSQMLVDN